MKVQVLGPLQGNPDMKRLFQHCSLYGQIRHIEHVAFEMHDPLIEAYSGARCITQVTMASPEDTRALICANAVEDLGRPLALTEFNLPMHVMISGADLDLPGLPLLDGIATEIVEQCVWKVCHRLQYSIHANRLMVKPQRALLGGGIITSMSSVCTATVTPIAFATWLALGVVIGGICHATHTSSPTA